MLNDYGNAAAQLMSLGAAQALDLLREVFPIERQIRANPGRVAQRSRLLLGPADEVLLIKLRGAAGNILSSDLNSFLKVIRAPEEINLE